MDGSVIHRVYYKEEYLCLNVHKFGAGLLCDIEKSLWRIGRPVSFKEELCLYPCIFQPECVCQASPFSGGRQGSGWQG